MFDYNLLSEEDLRVIFKDSDFALEPMVHQLITMAHVLDNNLKRTCLFHDIGTGKTLTALWITTFWKPKKILVVCPISAFDAWERDIRGYMDYSYVILEGEKAARIGHLEKDYDVYIINYEGLKSVYGTLEKSNDGAITDFKGEHCFLSNFYPSSVIWEDVRYPTSEHAFQAAKSLDPAVRQTVKRAKTASEAKHLDRGVQLRVDWEDVKYDVMMQIVSLKFLQHIDMTRALLKTGTAEIIEGNCWHDNIWGDCICPRCSDRPGQNLLGKILMQVRTDLGGQSGTARKWTIDFNSFIDGFDCLILDEEHKCKTHASIQAKLCYQLSRRAKYAIGMTGTPIGTHLLDLWNLVRTIDLGDHLGLNFYKFRQKYFRQNWHDWIPYKDTEEKILKRIAPMATSFKREDCLDLPDYVREVMKVEASAEQRKAIDDVMNGLAIEVEQGVVTPGNVLTRTQKLKEITGGFLYLKDKDGQRKTHLFKSNPKLQAVEDVVEATDYKIIIFHQFEEEGRILERWAKKKKIKYASMRGEIKDTKAEYKKFVNEPGIRLMIAHPGSASESLDMTVTFIEVFYSTGGFIDREQCEGRIRRKHQMKKQLFIDIVVRDSYDEIAVERIKERKDLSERVLAYIRNYGKKIGNKSGKATLFD